MTTRPEPGSRWTHRTAGWQVTVTNHYTHGGLDLVSFRPPKAVAKGARELAIQRSLFLADFVNSQSLNHTRRAPMEFHPLANIFPLFEHAELDDLAADIEAHGLREPVVVFENKILDGRNRYRACMELGKQPTYVAFHPPNDGDPLDFVISHNLRRRHLTESQRAMVAAKLANLHHGGDRSEQDANLRDAPVTTQKGAADLLNVSARSVSSARKVLEDGTDEVKNAVEAGEASVSAAATVATLPPDEQREAVASGVGGVRQKAAQTRHGGLTGDYEWMTPVEIVESTRKVLGAIDLDPASSHEANDRVGAARYYTKAEDGLNQGEWAGRLFLNPPYQATLVREFVHNLAIDFVSGSVTSAVAVLPSSTDTGWFHELAEQAAAICFPLGRLKFVHTNKPDAKASPTASTIFYLGDDPSAFVLEFDKHGICWSR